MAITLNTYTFLASVAVSSVSPWFPVDWRYAGIQQRSIMGTKGSSASDVINIELKTSVAVTTDAVIVTATSFAGSVTVFSAVIQGPFTDIRVRKEGASAAATVVGIV